MKLLHRLYHKIMRRFDGIPVLIVIYKPWVKGKDVSYRSIAPFETDEYLSVRFKEIAERIRESHQEKMDEILAKKEGNT